MRMWSAECLSSSWRCVLFLSLRRFSRAHAIWADVRLIKVGPQKAQNCQSSDIVNWRHKRTARQCFYSSSYRTSICTNSIFFWLLYCSKLTWCILAQAITVVLYGFWPISKQSLITQYKLTCRKFHGKVLRHNPFNVWPKWKPKRLKH